jgi:hypothetical protein
VPTLGGTAVADPQHLREFLPGNPGPAGGVDEIRLDVGQPVP